MEPNEQHRSTDSPAGEPGEGYSPPSVTFLGTLADLTQEKEVGAADGTMVLGIDVGS